MATLTNTKIKDTYKSLLKVSDNGNLEASLQEITDGEGNASGVQLNTGGDLTASGTVAFGSLKDSGENITITKFVDEADGIGSNDNDTSIPTSAAVKNYVDTNVTAQDLDFAGDSGTGAVDLDSQTFTIAGTANEIETSASGQTITIGLPNNVNISGNLAVDTNTLYVESTNNRVGIGTSSGLAAKLDISNSAGEPALKLKSTNSSLFSSSKLYNDSDKGLDSIVYGSAYAGGTVMNVGANGLALYSNTTTALTTLGSFPLLFGVGNSEAMRIDSSGRVGIGTSSPNYNLTSYKIGANANYIQVANGSTGVNSANGTLFGVDASGNGTINVQGAFNLITTVAGAERMRIDSSGNVGIGGTPSSKLHIQSGALTVSGNSIDTVISYSNVGIIGTTSNHDLTFVSNSTERMRIDSSGNLLVGSTTAAAKMHIQGGTTIASLTDWNTKANTTFSLANPAVRLGVGYNASDIPLIQGFDTSNASRNISLQPYGGNVGIGQTPDALSKLAVYGGRTYLDATNEFTIRLSNSGTVGGFIGTPASGALGFYSSSGGERMRIDSSGNIGIGTSSPRTKTHISGLTSNDNPSLGSSTAPLFVSNTANSYGLNVGVNNGGASWLQSQSNTSATAYDLLLNPLGGNVGIGTSPSAKLHINAGTDNYAAVFESTDANALISFKDNNSASILANYIGAITNDLVFGANSAERMRIKSGGDVVIGASAGAPLTLVPSSDGFATAVIQWNKTDTASQTAAQFLISGVTYGSITYATAGTSYNTSSDYRLKENVVPMEGALDRVDALKPSRFNFITDPEKTVDGFLAHEVAEVIPEAITGEKDAVEEYEVTPAVLDEDGNVIEEAVMGTRPIYQGIDQSKIVPLLVGAIQELKAEIELLKSQING